MKRPLFRYLVQKSHIPRIPKCVFSLSNHEMQTLLSRLILVSFLSGGYQLTFFLLEENFGIKFVNFCYSSYSFGGSSMPKICY